MCKTELCERIIALVASEADLAMEDIVSKSRCPEMVDARYIAIYVMLQKNISIRRIAAYMNMSERSVYRVKEQFDDRIDYGDPMLERYYKAVLMALS